MLSPKITGVRTPPSERKRFDLWIAVSFLILSQTMSFSVQRLTFNKGEQNDYN